MAISTDEMTEFLGIVGEKGFLNPNTSGARLTACRKFIDILDPEQRTVEYLSENLDVIKQRFMNLNTDVAGATVDEYARRVKLVIDDFTEWKADRGGWERKNAAKQNSRSSGDGEKKAKPKAEKSKAESAPASIPAASSIHVDRSLRTVEFPLRSGDAKVTFPRDLTMADVKKIAWGLMPYAADFDPEVSARDPFPALGQQRDLRDTQ